MSAGDAKLDRLHAGLTARERVLLLHRALLTDEKADPAIRATMPREQGREFNHYVGLANGVLRIITPRALALHYEVEALWLKLLLLGTQVMWGLDRSALLFNASLLATIPIPQARYEQELNEQRDERLTLRDIVELVQSAKDEESDAAGRQAERDVRAAVKSGALPSRKRGRGFDVELGALFDWMREPLEPHPDWGWRYEPVPEDEREGSSLRLSAVEWMRAQMDRGPSHPARVLPAMSLGSGSQPPAGEVPANEYDRLTCGLADVMRAEIPALSVELAAIETAAKEVCDEFGDDLVIPTEVRKLLVESRESSGRRRGCLASSWGPSPWWPRSTRACCATCGSRSVQTRSSISEATSLR